MSKNTSKTKNPANRTHPFLREGEEFDPTQPPQDIRKMFYRAVIPDDMIQQMIESIEDNVTGMVEGTGIHAALLDLKKMKFLCNGIVHAYFNEQHEQVSDYMNTLGAVLNVRIRNTTADDAKQDTNENDSK